MHDLEFIRGSRGSPNPADPAEAVAGPAARTPPSTRAGGQDDGSLNKLPQISVYLHCYFLFCRICAKVIQFCSYAAYTLDG